MASIFWRCKRRRAKADIFVANGYQFIPSGEDTDHKVWAGMGFFVPRSCRHLVKADKQISDQSAWIKQTIRMG
eukprot:6510519-Pyramimonas_sp.AAC.1